MDDTVALLQQLGFGGYEARAYIALLQRSPLI
jgi:sugar-specific transcriptional regulator TrmB